MGDVCADLDVELIEFNGEPTTAPVRDYPPTLAISFWSNGLKAAPLTLCGTNTPAPVSAPASADTSGPVLLRRLLQRSTAVDHQAIHRRTNTPPLTAGLPPADKRDGLTPR